MARPAGAIWPTYHPLQPLRAMAESRRDAITAAYDGDIQLIDSTSVRARGPWNQKIKKRFTFGEMPGMMTRSSQSRDPTPNLSENKRSADSTAIRASPCRIAPTRRSRAVCRRRAAACAARGGRALLKRLAPQAPQIAASKACPDFVEGLRDPGPAFWVGRAQAARGRNKKAVKRLKTNNLAKSLDFAS
jgi:hypothetical protein